MASRKLAAPPVAEYGWRKPRILYPYAPVKAAHKRGGNMHAEPDTCDVRTWEDATARQTAMLTDPAHLAWLASPPDTDSDAATASPAPEPAPVAVRVAPDGFGAVGGQPEAAPGGELARARAELVRLGVLVPDSWEVAA